MQCFFIKEQPDILLHYEAKSTEKVMDRKNKEEREKDTGCKNYQKYDLLKITATFV